MHAFFPALSKNVMSLIAFYGSAGIVNAWSQHPMRTKAGQFTSYPRERGTVNPGDREHHLSCRRSFSEPENLRQGEGENWGPQFEFVQSQ